MIRSVQYDCEVKGDGTSGDRWISQHGDFWQFCSHSHSVLSDSDYRSLSSEREVMKMETVKREHGCFCKKLFILECF